MKSKKISQSVYLLICVLLSIVSHAQANYLVYTPLSQTVSTNSGVEVVASVQVSCYGGQSTSLLVAPTYCAWDDGLKSITYSNGTYLTPGSSTIITFKFKATVSQNITSIYKFSTNSSCLQNEAQMIKITVNYNYTTPPSSCQIPTNLTTHPPLYPDRFALSWENQFPVYELQYRKTTDINWSNQNTDIYYGDIFCSTWVKNLMPNTQYYWRIRGLCNNGQYGPWTMPQSASTASCVTTPISNVSATPSGSGYIINFTQATSNSQIYFVMDYVDLTNGSTGSGITIYNGAYFYYVSPPRSFKFKIRVVGGCNIPDSDWVTVNPAICPSNNYPTTLSFSTASMCGGGMQGRCCGYGQFTYSAVPGATSYQVEYMGVNLTNATVPPVIGTFQTSSTNTTQPTTYACNSNQAGTWILKYRVKSKCPNGTWSDFSPWSSNFAW